MELGKIDKPYASKFKEKRKLYVIPILPFEDIASQLKIDTAKIEQFWGEVRDKIEYFISTYGNIDIIYVEGVEDDKAGIEFFERYGKESNHYKLIKSLMDRGAKIKGIDKEEYLKRSKLLFEEYSRSFLPEIKEIHKGFYGKDIDFEGWRKYLVNRIQEINELMCKTASDVIKNMPAHANAVLIITEGRAIEFPENTDVFQIKPPTFDDLVKSMRTSTL